MTATTDTVHERIECARIDVTPARLFTMVALTVAVGFVLLFLQEPLAHDSLHDFRHAIGVACH